MKKTTHYLLVHRITRKPLTLPVGSFSSMTAAAVYALENDLHADVLPAAWDLLGDLVAEDPEISADRSLPLG
jgi:hypothetical protein